MSMLKISTFMKKIFFSFILLCNFTYLYAQTGPGGVGNSTGAGGQPRNILWLRADLGTTIVTGVSAWNDQSGNNNNFSQGTTTMQPALISSGLNGRSLLRFDGSNDFIRATGTGLHATSALPMTFFAATNSNAGQTNPKGLFDSAPNRGDVFRFLNDGSGSGNTPAAGNDNSVEFHNNNPALGGYTLNASAPTIVTVLGDLSSGNRRLTLFRDGTQIRTGTGNATALVFDNNPQFGRVNTGFNFSGDIAESIIFNGVALNAAQRLVVENYLGATYGQSLVANDYFSNANTNGAAGYNYNVIGLVGLSSGEKHSQSTSNFITIEENTSSLTTIGAAKIFFAGGLNPVTNPNAQAGDFLGSSTMSRRWQTEYWIEKNLTDYKISFDFTSLALTCPPSGLTTDYKLLVRPNTGVNFTELAGAIATISGTTVTFTVIGDATTLGFMTIGFNSGATTPGTLYSFNGNCLAGCNWENASSWTQDPTGATSISPSVPSACNGNDVIIRAGHTVNITANAANANDVVILSGGKLAVGTTTGNNFNSLGGSGTLSLSAVAAGTPVFPTVVTNTHLTTTGSTVEYTGSTNINLATTPTTYRNVVISGTGIKTMTANYTVNETLSVDAGSTLESATRNLTVAGNTTIVGNLLKNSVTGTVGLQNLIMNGGTINGGAIGTVTVGGNLSFSGGSSTIGQSNLTVTGTTTLNAASTVNFSSNLGTKTFSGATTLNGSWTNTGNQAFNFDNSFTVNSSAILNSGTACNYNFTGTGNLNGTMATYTLPIMEVTGTYTNSIPQLLVTGDINVRAGGKLINVSSIVPPYFMGFNTARPAIARMDATGVSNNVGNIFGSPTNNGGNNIYFDRAAGTLYTVRHTDLQTNATPATQAVMVHFGIGTWATGGAVADVGRLVVGSGFADDNTIPAAANTTASITINHEASNSMSLTANGVNLGNRQWGDYIWVINPTGAAITYRQPGSNLSVTVAAGTMDIWSGGTLLRDDGGLTTTGLNPTDFKFIMNNGTRVLNLYNFRIVPITTPEIGAVATIYCTSLTAPSATFNVPYTLPISASTDTHFNAGNEISVQLSNAAGVFEELNGMGVLVSRARTIGTLVTTAISGTISCAIPANTQGAAYRMRIVTREPNVNAGFVGANNGTNIVINGYRTSPTLPQTLAVGASGTTLSITDFGGNPASPLPTAYQWAYTVPGSTVVNNIVGATAATYIPAPPLTSVSNTYKVFCILTSACGASFSDGIQISVNCSVTTELATNGKFTTLKPIAYPLGTPPAGHVDTGWGFSTQYGNPTTGLEAPATVDCNGGSGDTRPCSMYPETTFAVGFSPADYHTNFCNNNPNSTNPTVRSTNVNSAPGSAVIPRTGTVEVQAGSLTIVRGTGTNFQADLVGSVIYVGVSPNSQRSLITAVNVATQEITVSPAYTAAFAAGSDYKYMHGSRVIGGSGGYCLVGNGATGGSINIWQQNIAVTPNRNYVLTFNAANLNGGALAFATFFNCFQVGANVDNPGVEACNWAKYSVQWNSGAYTTLNMAIRNVGLAAGGNDIVVDDISFYECIDPVLYPSGDAFVWRGFNTDWFNGDNWGSCNAPTCVDDVVIPVVATGRVYPIINGNGATARSVTINTGASLTLAANRNINVCGHLTNNGLLANDITSSVTFTSNYNPQIVTGTFTGTSNFGSLIVNKTAAAQVLRFDNDANITKDLTITNGTINGNSRTLQVAGNFTNSANGTFTANSSTVVFNGAASQTFTNAAATAACQFFNFTANQTVTSTILLTNDLTVTGTLNLTSGRLNRTGAAGFRYVNVTNNVAGSITNYNANSYIATIPFTTDRLILKRAINNLAGLTYNFPVGDATNFQNIRMEVTTALGATLTNIESFFTSTNASGTVSEGLCQYQACTGGYWTLNPNMPAAGTARYNIELFPVGFACPSALCTNTRTIAKGTFPSTWGFAGSTYTSGNKRSTFSSFTDFVPMGGFIILPVSLLKFDAKALGNVADLRWTTSTELNNKEFEVQRTLDGINFVTLGTVNGGGTKNTLTEYSFIDTKPNRGVNYYRLRQIDFDGKYAYSKIQAVKFDGDKFGTLAIYPNPVNDNLLTIEMPFDKNERVLVTITDMLGKVLYEKVIFYNGTSHIITSNFAAGVYAISVSSKTQTFHEKVVYQQR